MKTKSKIRSQRHDRLPGAGSAFNQRCAATRKAAMGDFFESLDSAGERPNSTAAIGNLTALCREHLPERHEIEVVNIVLQKGRALADGVMLTPMLVKYSQASIRKIVGTLSRGESALLT